MKRAAVIFYTDRGGEMAKCVAESLRDWEMQLFRSKCQIEELFREMDALIFVGACGIAVRSIAPHVKCKATDPAVIVLDERGQHVISLLSGHIGGANELARSIAAFVGGTPVITTATDVNGRFAVDEWAAKQGLVISSMTAAKHFAAEILKRDIAFHSDFSVRGELPNGLYSGEGGLVISCHKKEAMLQLIPRILHLGIGCKRGTSRETIEAAVQMALDGMDLRAIADASSIDVKADEAGLLAYCRGNHLEAKFYTAEELQNTEGSFTSSVFVQTAVGVDNVCERAAMRSAGKNATLIIKKTCVSGVTIAVAQENWSVCFE